jgi:hypothetical protein
MIIEWIINILILNRDILGMLRSKINLVYISLKNYLIKLRFEYEKKIFLGINLFLPHRNNQIHNDTKLI